MPPILHSLLLLFLCSSLFAQSLREQISEKTENFAGDVGVYVEHLKTNEIVTIQADTLFPTASMIKVPILLKLFELIDDGRFDYRQELVWYADSINYPDGGGILASFEDGKKIQLSKIISLMINYSDNHASLWCQKLAGGGKEINTWLAQNGYPKTRVNSRTPGRHKNWEVFGWGQTTPREMARMLKMIRTGEAVSPAASEEMYRILTNIYWKGEALSGFPPYIQAASKQGAVSQSRSEVVLVNPVSGDYVFCVITKNQTDSSWEYDNQGFVLLRDISRILWNYFEPALPWQPADGAKRYH